MKPIHIILAVFVVFLSVSIHYADRAGIYRRPITVGLIHFKGDREVPWHTKNVESLRDSLAADDAATIFFAGKTSEEQIRAVRYCTRQKVDALVLVPITETGWDDVLDECRKSGIPVIVADRDVHTADDSLVTERIHLDSTAEGNDLFDIMNDYVKVNAPAKKDGTNYNIALIEGVPVNIDPDLGAQIDITA